ncbi:MAG: hypothetical protein P1U74_03615 [Legionellaceae bacterium]|nr:hypothetical protein [Legionellaceae bacterium]
MSDFVKYAYNSVVKEGRTPVITKKSAEEIAEKGKLIDDLSRQINNISNDLHKLQGDKENPAKNTINYYDKEISKLNDDIDAINNKISTEGLLSEKKALEEKLLEMSLNIKLLQQKNERLFQDTSKKTVDMLSKLKERFSSVAKEYVEDVEKLLNLLKEKPELEVLKKQRQFIGELLERQENKIQYITKQSDAYKADLSTQISIESARSVFVSAVIDFLRFMSFITDPKLILATNIEEANNNITFCKDQVKKCTTQIEDVDKEVREIMQLQEKLTYSQNAQKISELNKSLLQIEESLKECDGKLKKYHTEQDGINKKIESIKLKKNELYTKRDKLRNTKFDLERNQSDLKLEVTSLINSSSEMTNQPQEPKISLTVENMHEKGGSSETDNDTESSSLSHALDDVTSEVSSLSGSSSLRSDSPSEISPNSARSQSSSRSSDSSVRSRNSSSHTFFESKSKRLKEKISSGSGILDRKTGLQNAKDYDLMQINYRIMSDIKILGDSAAIATEVPTDAPRPVKYINRAYGLLDRLHGAIQNYALYNTVGMLPQAQNIKTEILSLIFSIEFMNRDYPELKGTDEMPGIQVPTSFNLDELKGLFSSSLLLSDVGQKIEKELKQIRFALKSAQRKGDEPTAVFLSKAKGLLKTINSELTSYLSTDSGHTSQNREKIEESILKLFNLNNGSSVDEKIKFPREFELEDLLSSLRLEPQESVSSQASPNNRK